MSITIATKRGVAQTYGVREVGSTEEQRVAPRKGLVTFLVQVNGSRQFEYWADNNSTTRVLGYFD